MVEVVVPSAAMLVGLAVMVEVAVEGFGSIGIWLLMTPFDVVDAVVPIVKEKSR